ncbi:uncharacterized protein KZ484_000743 isoform 1-T3 [Pholidichthys leucotaenia]
MAPEVSKSMYDLQVHSTVFSDLFDSREAKLRKIVGEFEKISEEVKNLHETEKMLKTAGATAAGVVGLGVSIVALLLGRVSLAAVAAIGGTAVAGSCMSNIKTVSGRAKKVQELGEEFMEIVEPIKKELEDIKKACEELEQEPVKTDKRPETSLAQVSTLKERSSGVLGAFKQRRMGINELKVLVEKAGEVSPSPEDDVKFKESIQQTAVQSQKVIDGCLSLKEELSTLVL